MNINVDYAWDEDCYGVYDLEDDYHWYEIMYLHLQHTWVIREITSTFIRQNAPSA